MKRWKSKIKKYIAGLMLIVLSFYGNGAISVEATEMNQEITDYGDMESEEETAESEEDQGQPEENQKQSEEVKSEEDPEQSEEVESEENPEQSGEVKSEENPEESEEVKSERELEKPESSEEIKENMVVVNPEPNTTSMGPGEDIQLDTEYINNEGVEYVLGRPMTDEEKEKQRQLMEKYISHLTFFEPDEEVESVLSDREERARSAQLPSAYSSVEQGYVTSVKNQNPFGTCWAFSSMNLAETSLIKKGLMSQNDADLSEYHIAYYAFRSVTDPLGGTQGDRNYKSSLDSILGNGGNYSAASNAMLAWMGVADEKAVPYPSGIDAVTELPETVDAAYGQNIALLKNTREINTKDVSLIKQTIMDWGAVGISYYSTFDSSYYNPDTAAQYCNNDTLGTNHAVSIVGWNDEYSKNNFATSPSKDGAWLVKNSWGEEFGQKGYFWLSYEDATIHDTVFAFDMVKKDAYDNNYQYDGASGNAFVSSMNELTVANIFTAHAKEGKKEILKAVSFAVNSVNTDYRIQIYKNPKDAGNPESGVAVLPAPQTGNCVFSGTYTVDLESPVELEYGDIFAVVITLYKSDGNVRLRLEWSSQYSSASALPGCSLLKSGRFWSEYGSGCSDTGVNGANFRIKAYTVNTDLKSGLYSSINISGKSMISNIGDTSTYQVIIEPANAVSGQVTWSSSDKEVISIDDQGVATATGIGSAVLTATLNSDNAFTASIKVTVPDSQKNRVRGFVERMYTIALNRKSDAAGAEYWTNQLLMGYKNGAEVAKGFILSREMENRKLNNSQFLDMVYRVLFDRVADVNGKAYWNNLLENGVSRAYVFRGFCHSQEFTNVCNRFEITRGSIELTENRDQNANVTMYVYRCYERTLERKPDVQGLNFWTGQILGKKRSPVNVAGNFVFSTEFKNRKLSDEAYVKILYRMFFDREYNAPGTDPNGLKFWLDELNSGRRDRYSVFLGFANSQEFENVLKTFGL